MRGRSAPGSALRWCVRRRVDPPNYASRFVARLNDELISAAADRCRVEGGPIDEGACLVLGQVRRDHDPATVDDHEETIDAVQPVVANVAQA